MESEIRDQKSEIDASAASRLCAACGMCCNGVLFQAVVLKLPEIKALKPYGFRFKTKRGQTSFDQPCVAFRETCCSVYENRPRRCRLFNCRQLLKLESAEITEEVALGKINEARLRSDRVKELLLKAGSTNLKRSLATRYEWVLAQPLESLTAGDLQTREQLIEAMRSLEDLLSAEFRV